MAGVDAGIKCSEDVIEHCKSFAKGANMKYRSTSWIIFKIQKIGRTTKVIVVRAGPPLATFEEMKAKIIPDSARYILIYTPYEMDGQEKEKVTLITYTGPKCSLNDKMSYQSTESGLYAKLGRHSGACKLRLTSYDSLELEKIKDAVQRK